MIELSDYEKMHGSRLIGILLLLNLFQMPDWYGLAVKIVALVWVILSIYWAANTKVWWKVVFFGLVALLVQPFLRPVFTSFVWFRIDIGLGLALVAYSFLDGYLSNED